MAELTLQEVFGENATQDYSTITIPKSDLQTMGLSASSDNTAESLIVAIVLKAAQNLNDTKQQTNQDIQVTINKGFDSLVTRNNLSYRQYQYTIEMQKLDTTTTPVADDF